MSNEFITLDEQSEIERTIQSYASICSKLSTEMEDMNSKLNVGVMFNEEEYGSYEILCAKYDYWSRKLAIAKMNWSPTLQDSVGL